LYADVYGPAVQLMRGFKGLYPKSIYNVEEKANVVGVGTDFKFKIFSGKLLDVAPKSRLADGLVTAIGGVVVIL
jgi:hypothetical protein